MLDFPSILQWFTLSWMWKAWSLSVSFWAWWGLVGQSDGCSPSQQWGHSREAFDVHVIYRARTGWPPAPISGDSMYCFPAVPPRGLKCLITSLRLRVFSRVWTIWRLLWSIMPGCLLRHCFFGNRVLLSVVAQSLAQEEVIVMAVAIAKQTILSKSLELYCRWEKQNFKKELYNRGSEIFWREKWKNYLGMLR